MQQQSDAWHVAIVNIVTQSDLHSITVWLGGLLFAAAAVLTAQGLSRYVAMRTAEVVANMSTNEITDTPLYHEPNRNEEDTEPYKPEPMATVSNYSVKRPTASVNNCAHCGKPMSGSSRKKYCDTTCKGRAQRARESIQTTHLAK